MTTEPGAGGARRAEGAEGARRAEAAPFPWIWTGGKRIERDAFRLDPFDEGLLYGRGLFETTRTFGSVPWLWDEHLARLEQSAAALGIPLDPAKLPSADQVAAFVRSLAAGDVVVRLQVTAGGGGAGRDHWGLAWLSARPLPEAKAALAVCVARYRVSRSDPWAEHKSTNYGLRALAWAEAREGGFDDALLVDTEGRVLEASRANLFVKVDGRWRTPPLEGGVLAGTARQQVLRRAAVPIEERTLAIAELDRVSAAFLTNSVRGAVAVSRIRERGLRHPSELRVILASLATEKQGLGRSEAEVG